MAIDKILNDFAKYSKLTSSCDDDWVDRLNHLYTVILLIIFCVFITTGQFVGSPIECWCPAEFKDHFVAYTKSYCWVKNTYHIPIDTAIPVQREYRDSEEITYYQWVPVILLLMAFLFKFPALVWRLFNGCSGMNVEKIVTMVNELQIQETPEESKTIKNIAEYINRWLNAQRQYRWNILLRMRQNISRFFCFCCGKRDGTYLTGLYMFVKALYATNVVTQFFLLNAFMGGWYSMYGFEVLEGLYNDHNWKDSPRFPKLTLCDFEIRQLQNIQTYTVQCVLPINLYNEKIFIFLWFWFVYVATSTCGNFLFWIWRLMFLSNRVAYVKKYLKLLGKIKDDDDKKKVINFADKYLKDDGVFILRLIARNSNDIILSAIVDALFEIRYPTKKVDQKKDDQKEDDQNKDDQKKDDQKTRKTNISKFPA